MEKEIKITPPEEIEIDRENSTLECIKFKPITKRWRDNKLTVIRGFYIDIDANICRHEGANEARNYNLFASEKQTKSALAMSRISQIMANDKKFGGPITDEEWMKNGTKWTIERFGNTYKGELRCTLYYTFLAFHTREQRDLFIKENEDLIKDYLMLD